MFLSKYVLRQYIIVLAVNLTGVGVGMTVAWPSPMLIKLMKEDTQLSRKVSEDEATWIVSCGCLLPIVFSHFISWISNKLGRKTTLLLISLLKACIYMVQIFATELWMLYAIRVISGILDTGILCNLLAYSAEIASKEIRGALVTIQQMSLATGMLIIFTVGPYATYLVVNVVFECITLLIVVPLIFIPESPCSLLGRGLKDEALQTLIYLRGSETKAKEEINEYTVSCEQNKHTISYRDKVFIKALAIVVLLSIGIQSIGYLTVTMYLQIILDTTGTSVSTEVMSVVFGVLQLLAGLFAAVVTDRAGRKPILSITLVGLSIGMSGLGLFFYVKDSGTEITGIMNYLPLISVVMIVICFNAGPGSLINVVSSELLDSPVRSFGMSTSITCGLLVAFLNLKYFTLVADMIGSAAVFWMFAGVSLVYMMFILICVPETK
ncbi:facilitated trehalose transporter Tret1-like isoform X1 [Colias croceus]|uniref:facilitated trehalose transporter Tret1-like isoform X1 n=3 Tax=Colias crocea TaxID=72248 RepID=UPI001E27FF53|nr:facilitated trehalose transporter Tret1-like isoform X1 [Colias croceus]XP_045506723.1 facilitated trehalose transporter Tret1-like isoform X1 [Colias croceus]XP_045506724.1 facilitated trehalose transporter Tret1-like isoform X1 [Colias croceus]